MRRPLCVLACMGLLLAGLAGNAFASNNCAAELEAREEKAKVSSRQTSKMVSTRVLNVFSPRPRVKRQKTASTANGNVFAAGYRDSGMASGDMYAGLGLWSMGTLSYTDISKSSDRGESNIGIFMLGADKLFMNDKLAVGLGLGYENSWTKNKNIGRKDDGEGFAVTPYIAYRATEDFVIKAVGNFAMNSYDVNSARDYNGNRYMGDLAGEYSWIIDNWLLSAEAGYMYVSEDYNHNYQDIYLGEVRAVGKVAYEFENGFMPYFRGTIYQELGSSSGPGYAKTSYEGAIGGDYNVNSWTFSAELFDTTNEDQNTVGGSLLIRYEF